MIWVLTVRLANGQKEKFEAFAPTAMETKKGHLLVYVSGTLVAKFKADRWDSWKLEPTGRVG